MDTSQRQTTPAEAELERIFNSIGGGALTGEFVREWPLGNWLIDFYFPAVKLAIEVDGGYHRAPLQLRRDLHKAAELEAEGITLLRLANAEVFGERQHLIEKLRAAWRVAQARGQEHARAATLTRQLSDDRYKLREPAAAAYAVCFTVETRDVELIFAEELARLRVRFQTPEDFAPLSASWFKGAHKFCILSETATASLG